MIVARWFAFVSVRIYPSLPLYIDIRRQHKFTEQSPGE